VDKELKELVARVKKTLGIYEFGIPEEDRQTKLAPVLESLTKAK
jgi:hypothetical protein